jgi:hypothetical protein
MLHDMRYKSRSRDSSIGMEDRGSVFFFFVGVWNLSLRHRVQTECGDHPVSYPVGDRDKAAGA